MPIIKSAIKKVRKDKVRTIRNDKREAALKSLVKKARINKSDKNLQAAFSALDKAAKVHLIHPNKASRLKSRLSKEVKTTAPEKSVKKTAPKKSPPKSK
ncbi:MAG: hypothetical protein ACD_38C00085G0002 [uncultured bacterium]|uniref:Small ribosomal subunit protein bS20 n=1 Tax=Candidatus Daviesbacteria bacterium GW2011_GWC2_40_12 TaxID=1618431 RepID=A0A0G0QNR6_9BACT|nr:MAG: hypothetical protein ACD_38C00085G0002 [uncultured bacterium]KKQ84972.1 MAG: 30S ribosomal protein S20 [Candidatus Daviesbacteria bacterium GW2011_GWF2_38_7]KKR17005.1 MAG: 30S ribosomal protein S20 [Candidatus Daviesbacteria bacterium GW2011_GWA2_39_33]KKR23315.1 MAG: 30S ribosomal protein S20 [Candidatus Daviesbacteria bacterium GW2011_GWB1_39_5]KKR42069.1 MAG: 30S ribosomal protein S20 [Candidatus Daviesbacteria bacterium GW2011_GWC2_40_12]OGE20836.1 MAG: hypothetical protein A2778_